MNRLKKLTTRVRLEAPTAQSDDLRLVVDGLRAKDLLGDGLQGPGDCACSRERMGDELFEKLRLVCTRIDFFGSFDAETLVSCCVPV